MNCKVYNETVFAVNDTFIDSKEAIVLNGIEFIDFNYQHFCSIFEWTNKWIYWKQKCDFLLKMRNRYIFDSSNLTEWSFLFFQTPNDKCAFKGKLFHFARSKWFLSAFRVAMPHLHWHCTACECEMCNKLYWHRELKCIEETLNLYSLLGAVHSAHSEWFSSTNDTNCD